MSAFPLKALASCLHDNGGCFRKFHSGYKSFHFGLVEMFLCKWELHTNNIFVLIWVSGFLGQEAWVHPELVASQSLMVLTQNDPKKNSATHFFFVRVGTKWFHIDLLFLKYDWKDQKSSLVIFTFEKYPSVSLIVKLFQSSGSSLRQSHRARNQTVGPLWCPT